MSVESKVQELLRDIAHVCRHNSVAYVYWSHAIGATMPEGVKVPHFMSPTVTKSRHDGEFYVLGAEYPAAKAEDFLGSYTATVSPSLLEEDVREFLRLKRGVR